MEAKFKKGDKVAVTTKQGRIITGEIRDWDYNACTFEREYDLDYDKDGKKWTIIGVPEDKITLLDNNSKTDA